MNVPVGKEEADTVLPGSSPSGGTATVRGCSVESWTVRLVSGLVPVFLIVIANAAFPFVSLTRFADWMLI